VERTEEIIRLVWEVEKQIDTVIALGIGARCENDGQERVVAPILQKLGLRFGAGENQHRDRKGDERRRGACGCNGSSER